MTHCLPLLTKVLLSSGNGGMRVIPDAACTNLWRQYCTFRTAAAVALWSSEDFDEEGFENVFKCIQLLPENEEERFDCDIEADRYWIEIFGDNDGNDLEDMTESELLLLSERYKSFLCAG